jgi:hypothetical protein
MTEGLPFGKIDIAINLTEFNVCCKNAVRSVLRYPNHFAAMHLIQYGYSTTAELYPGWKEDLAKLTENGLAPIWHSELDANKLKSRAIIHLQPDGQLRDAALDALLQDMNDHHKNASHFAVSSVTNLEHQSPRSIPFYGFLLVLAVFDSLRSFFLGFRYHKTSDLRATTTYITFPATVEFAAYRWWAWLFFTRISPVQSGGAALQQIPDKKDAGASFVLRTIKTHNRMGIGLWMIGFALYYALFAWPWWSSFFAHYKIPYISKLFSFILEREPPIYGLVQVYLLGYKGVYVNLAWQVIQLLHLAFVGVIAYIYILFPYNGGAGLVLLYPFYLAAFPFLYVFSRFYVSRAAWTVEGEEEEN